MPASRRVSASQRVRDQLDELFGSGRELGQILEEVARLGVALLFQTAFEAEVTEFLGRERYARGERVQEGPRAPDHPFQGVLGRPGASPLQPRRLQPTPVAQLPQRVMTGCSSSLL